MLLSNSTESTTRPGLATLNAIDRCPAPADGSKARPFFLDTRDVITLCTSGDVVKNWPSCALELVIFRTVSKGPKAASICRQTFLYGLCGVPSLYIRKWRANPPFSIYLQCARAVIFRSRTSSLQAPHHCQNLSLASSEVLVADMLMAATS